MSDNFPKNLKSHIALFRNTTCDFKWSTSTGSTNDLHKQDRQIVHRDDLHKNDLRSTNYLQKEKDWHIQNNILKSNEIY